MHTAEKLLTTITKHPLLFEELSKGFCFIHFTVRGFYFIGLPYCCNFNVPGLYRFKEVLD